MDITKTLNEVIDYVERNLENDIDLLTVSKIAGCSTFHFTRMFSYIAGISFSEYVRKRKLTRATSELQHSDIKIVDLCLKYGYESPTSFNRAFKSLHGVSPSRARKEGITLKSYLPLTFQITIKGVVSMDYRIEKRDGFRAVGIKKTFTTENEENFKGIPLMWNKAMEDGTFQTLASLNNGEPKGYLGLCNNMVGKEFDYYIAVSSSSDIPEGYNEIVIHPQLYAIFPCEMKDIQDVTKRIFSEWLPNSNYNHASATEIEYYPDENSCEIMIPIK